MTQQGFAFLLLEDETAHELQARELSAPNPELQRIAARMTELENLVAGWWVTLEVKQLELSQRFMKQAPGQQKPNPLLIPGGGGIGDEGGNKRETPQEREIRELVEIQKQQELDRMQAEVTRYQDRIMQAQVEYSRKNDEAIAKQMEIERLWVALNQKAETIGIRYRALNDDDEVKAALAELNQDGIKYTVGPRERFMPNPSNAWISRTMNKGKPAAKDRTTKAADQDNNAQKRSQKPAVALHTGAPRPAVSLSLALRGLQKSAIELKTRKRVSPGEAKDLRQQFTKWSRKIQDLEAEQPGAGDAAQKRKRDFELKEAKTQLVKYKKKEDERKESVNVRDAFVQTVADVRKAVDPGQAPNGNLTAADDYLKKAEAIIVTEEVPLQPDKAMVWVDVLVNEQARKMLVEPHAETVRMSAKAAADLGVKTSENDQRVRVTLDDGQVLEARQTFLKSMQVGGKEFKVGEVECLIIPDYEAPPVLGASFLEQFSSKVDLDAGRLILKKVLLDQLNKLSTLH